MDELDLEKLSRKELIALEKRIAAAIDQKRSEALKSDAEKIKKIIEESSFSKEELLAEAFGRKGGSKKTTMPPKYANPNDPTATWTGKGRRPQWFLDAIEAGKTKEDLEIQ